MGVTVDVGEGVVLAVVGDPGDDPSLDGHRAQNGDDRPERARRLEGAVGEQPVVAQRDAQCRDDVEAGHEAQLQRSDRAVPEQDDGDDHA
jgi:hypothetical protein